MAQTRARRERVELEEKMAFLEKALAELNDALVDQSRTVIELGRRVEALEQVVRGISLEMGVERPRLPHEKPPHY
jgi:uncharacterized coiled-coil protein SlyX